jgi:hypothetical protein
MIAIEAMPRKTGWDPRYSLIAAIALLGLVGLALLIFSIGGLFGLVSTPVGPVRQHLSPADLASSAVAGATLMLAVFTAYLALETRASVAATRREAAIAEQSLAAAQELARIGAAQVEATNRQAEIAQETLEASWRPILVDVPRGFSVDGDEDAHEFGMYVGKWSDAGPRLAAFEVPFRNIGSGPAFIRRALIAGGVAPYEAYSFTGSIVSPGEMAKVKFVLLQTEAVPIAILEMLQSKEPRTAEVAVTVWYTDQRGQRTWRTRAVLGTIHDDRYEVSRVALYEADSTDPFAQSSVGTKREA